jgi:carbon monoxide dehydrogenase subunit G
MKITGTSVLAADRATVWRALNDPSVLVATIPGCQRLEALGDDAYKMTVAAGVGSIKGVYDGEVRLSDQQEPGSFRMRAQGAGAPGTIGADVTVTLADAPEGRTHLTYAAEAVVGGMIGGVGQRMLTGVSKRMAAEFFANVDTVLAGGTTPAPAAVAEALAVAGSADGGTAGVAAGPGAPKPSALASLGLPPDPSTVAPAPSVQPPAQSGAAPGTVFTAPAPANASSYEKLGGNAGFALGVVAGAAAALVGAVVGGWIAGRRR